MRSKHITAVFVMCAMLFPVFSTPAAAEIASVLADVPAAQTVSGTESADAIKWNVVRGTGFYKLNDAATAWTFQNTDPAADAAIMTTGELGWYDMHISMRLTVHSGGRSNLYLRYKSPYSHYRIELIADRGKARLVKADSIGGECQLAEAHLTINDGKAHQVAAEAAGTQIRLHVDGQTLLDVTDGALTGGKAGFGGKQSVFTAEDIAVGVTRQGANLTNTNGSIDFGIPDYLQGISGNTVEERFCSQVAEIPEEIPLVRPYEIKGRLALFVDVNGNDENDGSIDKPFRTIARGLEEVKKRQSERKDGVVLYLREGRHVVDKSLEINEQLSGASPEKPFIISAYKNETVTISGGYEIPAAAFRPVNAEDGIGRLSEMAKSQTVVVDLKKLGITEYGSITESANDPQTVLYVNDEEMTLARWPNTNEVYALQYFADNSAKGGGFEMEYMTDRPSTWLNTGDIWMFGSFFAEYQKLRIQIKDINPEKHAITTVNSTDLGVVQSKHNTYYYTNVFEELDVPGEWFLDRATGKLYLFPTGDMDNMKIQLVTDGYPIFNYSNAKNVVLNGVTVEYGSGTMIQMKNGSCNVIQNCTIQNAGGYGIYLDGCYKCGIVNSTMQRIGSTMVYMMTHSEYRDIRALRAEQNFVQNCYLYGNAKSIANAVVLTGVRNIVSHNVIQNTAQSALFLWHAAESIIEYNELVADSRNVTDGGAIYIGGELAQISCHTRYNYIHHGSLIITNPMLTGIYMDDMSRGNFAYGNVIADYPTALKSHSGQEVVFCDNVIIGRDMDTFGNAMTDEPNYTRDFNRWYQNIINGFSWPIWTGLYSPFAPNWRARYPALTAYWDGVQEVVSERKNNPDYKLGESDAWLSTTRDFVVKNNLVYNHGPLNFSEFALPTMVGYDTNYKTDKDPGFVSIADGNYNFRRDAGVFEKIDGFVPPPFDRMGVVTGGAFRQELASVSDIECINPPNGSVGLSSHEKVVFKWTESLQSSYYKITVAKDPEFKTILCEDTTQWPYYEADLDEIGATYYWKVEAVSFSKNLKKNSVISPVWSFTSFNEREIEKYGVVERVFLKSEIEEAQQFADSITEGDGCGEYVAGTKEELAKVIDNAKKVMAGSNLQSQIDKQVSLLESAVLKAKCGIVKAEHPIINLREDDLLPSKNLEVQADGKTAVIKCAEGGGSVFLKEQIFAGDTVRFRLKLDKRASGSDWMAIGRANTTTGNIWDNGQVHSYLLVFNNGYELQKRNDVSVGDIITYAPEDLIRYGEWNDIEFSFLPVDNAVRATMKINGEVALEYVDDTIPIIDNGYLVLVAGGERTIEISAAQ